MLGRFEVKAERKENRFDCHLLKWDDKKADVCAPICIRIIKITFSSLSSFHIAQATRDGVGNLRRLLEVDLKQTQLLQVAFVFQML